MFWLNYLEKESFTINSRRKSRLIILTYFVKHKSWLMFTKKYVLPQYLKKYPQPNQTLTKNILMN